MKNLPGSGNIVGEGGGSPRACTGILCTEEDYDDHEDDDDDHDDDDDDDHDDDDSGIKRS